MNMKILASTKIGFGLLTVMRKWQKPVPMTRGFEVSRTISEKKGGGDNKK